MLLTKESERNGFVYIDHQPMGLADVISCLQAQKRSLRPIQVVYMYTASTSTLIGDIFHYDV